MSRIPKWKFEKTKVRVVFRLQFHATQIPQQGWDKIFVSFIPTDSGKVTAKTTKASVKNGSCKWSDPIYETTRLLQDPKTKNYDEKLYKLVVAMGSSRASLLGEAFISLAEFADALKPSYAALPLLGCSFGTILHVTVQLLTSKTGFREFEQQRELSVKDFQASSGKKFHNPNEVTPAPGTTECMDKVNAKFMFKGDSTGLPSLDEVGELDDEYEDSAVGVDGSSYTSESLYAEKNEFSGLIEFDDLKCRASGDATGFTAVQSSNEMKIEHNYKQVSSQLSNDWSHGWNSDCSNDNDLVSACNDSDKFAARIQVAESAVLQLKSETKSLQNMSDELSSETKNLVQQLSLELASGEKLARDINLLKSECSKFRNDIDQLKAASSSQHTFSRKIPSTLELPAEALFDNTGNRLSDFQSKLLHGIFLVECKAQQIRNTACCGHNDSGFDYVYSELDVLSSLIQNLKFSTARELSVESVSRIETTNQYKLDSLPEQHVQGQNAGRCFADFHNSEGIKEGKLSETLKHLDVSKSEDGSFADRMTQMECYYEASIHKLEEKQKQTSDQLESLRAEHSSCFYTISDLQNQIEKLHKELNDNLIRFSEDRHSLESLNEELEKRAISSETMLKRVRWNYAIAVDRLQKDLELLSFQVLSMYETNETLTKQALIDANDQHCDVHSKKIQMLHQGELFVSPMQNQQKSAFAEIQTDFPLKNGNHELSTMLNDVSEKFDNMILYNFTSKEEKKSTSQAGLSMATEFEVNKELNVSVNSLQLHGVPSAASIQDILLERKNPLLCHKCLMEKHWNSYLQNLNTQCPINYFEKSENTENMKVVCHFTLPENQLLNYRDGLKEREMLVDAIYGVEVSKLLIPYFHWEVYALVLQETLREVFPAIYHMNETATEPQQKIKPCTNDMEFLVEMHSPLDESRKLGETEAKYLTRYNELVSKNHIMEAKLSDALHENCFLMQKVADCKSLIVDFEASESKHKALAAKKIELEDMLEEEKLQKVYLQSKTSSLNEDFKLLKVQHEKKCSLNSDLQFRVAYLQDKFQELCNHIILCSQQLSNSIFDDVLAKEELNCGNYDAIISYLNQFQQTVSCTLLSLQQEKNQAEAQREIAQRTLNERELHFVGIKQKFESDLEEARTTLEDSSSKVKHLQIELQDAAEKLKLSKAAEEWLIFENRKLLSNMSILEVELHQATVDCRGFSIKLLAAESVKDELVNTKLELEDLIQKNLDLSSSIHSRNEVSSKMEYEISNLKDRLHYAHAKLLSERKIREDLEISIADLKLQMVETSNQLLSFNEQNDELCHLRMKVLDLERDVQRYVMFCEEHERKVESKTSSLVLEISNIDNLLVTELGHSIAADVEVTFMRNEFCLKTAEFVVHQKASNSILEEIHLKNLDAVVSLEKYIASEAIFLAERERLLTDLLLTKSRIEILFDEKESLQACIDANTIKRSEFDDLKTAAAIAEASYVMEKQQCKDEISMLKSMLPGLEELDELLFSQVELDIMVVFFRSNFIEHRTHIAIFEECDRELRKLREQHVELNQKLSEQSLKAEEFRNLSIHLRELKDKEDAERHQACERRESEGTTFAVQESLRIAFIKEQYESKIQELRNQCSFSRKYAEEMLMKLQNSIDDNETRKKNQASLAKRNEELSVLLSSLQSELQTVVASRRELSKAFDRMKTELECTNLSLECCKEEKLKLQNSLKEISEERDKIRVELDLVKRLLENMTSNTCTGFQRNFNDEKPDTTLIGELLEDGHPGSIMYDETLSALDITSGDQLAKVVTGLVSETFESSPLRETDIMKPARNNKDSYMSVGTSVKFLKDYTAERAKLLENSATQISDAKECFMEQQKLIIGVELLHKQLQRLRNENLSSELQLEEDRFNADLQDLQIELSQLNLVNEQLGGMYPAYKELPSYGNALERVLALELQLVKGLQVKKSLSLVKSSSLCLRQLKEVEEEEDDDDDSNKEAAVLFRILRDINELIKEMIDLKKKHASVETELQEMHGRYSQLSLQFAEVEAERQKLVMSLKNSRTTTAFKKSS